MKKLIYSLLAVFSFSLSAQENMSLEQVISEALKNSYDIKVAENNVKKAQMQHHIGNAGMLPEISMSGRYNSSTGDVTQEDFIGREVEIKAAKNSGSSASIDARQTIFDGFRMFNTYNKFGEAVNLSNLREKEEIENMTAQVITAYYDVISAQQNFNLMEQSVNLNNDQYEMIKKREAVGKSSMIDRLNQEVILAEDSTAMLDAKIRLTQATNYLSFLLGGKDLSNVQLIGDLSLQGLADKGEFSVNVEDNILVQQAQSNIKLTELDYKIYKAARMPQIFANVGYSLSNSTSDFGFANSTRSNSLYYGVTASWTLFQGFRNDIQIKTAEIDVLNQEISRDQIKENLNRDARNAQEALYAAMSKIRLQERNLVIYQKQYEVSKQLFELGKRTALELRDAQRQLIQAENRLFSAKVEAKKQEIEILRLSGKLIS